MWRQKKLEDLLRANPPPSLEEKQVLASCHAVEGKTRDAGLSRGLNITKRYIIGTLCWHVCKLFVVSLPDTFT